jgi:hypothetical protein
MELLRLRSPSAWTPCVLGRTHRPPVPPGWPTKPDGPDRGVGRVLAGASRSTPRGTERLPEAGCRQVFAHRPRTRLFGWCASPWGWRRSGTRTSSPLNVATLRVASARPGGERLTGAPGRWRCRDLRTGATGDHRSVRPGAPCWRACRPKGVQEAAEASGGAIGGTISPKEISAAVTFAPRRCCLLTEMVLLGLQSPIGQERSSGGNQDGDDVCVGP